jgi:adenosylhomocysteinase
MPVLHLLAKREGHPLEGHVLAACLHLEAKTACLLLTLKELGAEVAVAGSNPLSTQDDVCAALVEGGVRVYSRHGMSSEEYGRHLLSALEWNPDLIIDDGGDLVTLIHERRRDLIGRILGGCEETTTGIKRLRAMSSQGILAFPMLAVNDAKSKHYFDNRYGTGQSVWDGLLRTTNRIVAGSVVVVAGYGWCGHGVAMRAAGLGARVVVVEADPHRALEAHMDGFSVLDLEQAAPLGDFFITVTGNTRVIRREHFALMRDGAILANAGHFDVEICIPDLESLAVRISESRPNVRTYETADGRRLHLLGEGRLVNLAAADGHPIEIMDMSFALQMASALYLARTRLEPGLYPVPEELDSLVARTKLDSLGLSLERLTEEQRAYLQSWRE